MSFEHGFIPVYEFRTEDWQVRATVYGSYNAWASLPQPISDLIAWGKPDLIAFDSKNQQILFSVEESAATPTGNQALQRCERLFGAAIAHVPFWYLLSEFGMHTDGHARRDSIWPTIMAMKLSADQGVPSIVLHYSDVERPEDYAAGEGLRSLFQGLTHIIGNASTGAHPLDGLTPHMEDQFRHMSEFVTRQWVHQIDYLPGGNDLSDRGLPERLAAAAAGDMARRPASPGSFLRWPRTSGLPAEAQALQAARSLIKHDPFVEALEGLVEHGVAYGPSKGSGSRPQPVASVARWIEQQQRLFEQSPGLEPPARFAMHVEDFPASGSGGLHVTTAKRIAYLVDRWGDVLDALQRAYPRLLDRLDRDDNELPAIVYVSNSLMPGRFLGDPFTGQIAAFGVAFGKL